MKQKKPTPCARLKKLKEKIRYTQTMVRFFSRTHAAYVEKAKELGAQMRQARREKVVAQSRFT